MGHLSSEIDEPMLEEERIRLAQLAVGENPPWPCPGGSPLPAHAPKGGPVLLGNALAVSS
jgi:hypothetical protein